MAAPFNADNAAESTNTATRTLAEASGGATPIRHSTSAVSPRIAAAQAAWEPGQRGRPPGELPSEAQRRGRSSALDGVLPTTDRDGEGPRQGRVSAAVNLFEQRCQTPRHGGGATPTSYSGRTPAVGSSLAAHAKLKLSQDWTVHPEPPALPEAPSISLALGTASVEHLPALVPSATEGMLRTGGVNPDEDCVDWHKAGLDETASLPVKGRPRSSSSPSTTARCTPPNLTV